MYISVYLFMFPVPRISLAGLPGQRLVCLLMLVVQRKLICTGWTYLAQFLCSFYKLFIPDDPRVFCLRAGITVLMPRHFGVRCSVVACSVAGGQGSLFFLPVLYKMSKSTKTVTLVMPSRA